MRHNTLWCIGIYAMFLSSCGGYSESVTQLNSNGEIRFIGNTIGAVVTIDDGYTFKLESGNIVYKVKTGTHNLSVKRNGQVVVARSIVIDSGATMEVEIP